MPAPQRTLGRAQRSRALVLALPRALAEPPSLQCRLQGPRPAPDCRGADCRSVLLHPQEDRRAEPVCRRWVHSRRFGSELPPRLPVAVPGAHCSVRRQALGRAARGMAHATHEVHRRIEEAAPARSKADSPCRYCSTSPGPGNRGYGARRCYTRCLPGEPRKSRARTDRWMRNRRS
jgi:hypothetical protein